MQQPLQADPVDRYIKAFFYFIIGWLMYCLQDMLMRVQSWWTCEVGGLLSGLISEVELGAQSGVYGLANIAYMFPIGFSVAGNVKVGNAMGAGDHSQHSLVLITKLTTPTHRSGKWSSNRNYIGCYHLKLHCIWGEHVYYYFFLQSNQAAGGSIVKGLGKQKIGAICNPVGYYAVGFPAGISLMFAVKWGIFGEAYM
uniref:Uncharacterized protein n=1 Tax=Cyprinus carpio carpio TaxID=630221 RepID=A0A9J7XT17_CYPCA